MMSAQEEFNQLLNNTRAQSTAHPEDRHDDNPHFSDEDSDLAPRHLRQRRVVDSSDNDDDDADAGNMVSSRTAGHRIPNTVYNANTGPKGVIADAQAFERARKKSFRRTLLSAAGFDSTRDEPSQPPATEGSSGSEDEEERFMRKWRASRMQEIQARGMRRPSPRGRHWGSVDTVDAAGYLDAIEKVTSDTVVVVCIYDPEVCHYQQGTSSSSSSSREAR